MTPYYLYLIFMALALSGLIDLGRILNRKESGHRGKWVLAALYGTSVLLLAIPLLGSQPMLPTRIMIDQVAPWLYHLIHGGI